MSFVNPEKEIFVKVKREVTLIAIKLTFVGSAW